jgi:hypothetical protein
MGVFSKQPKRTVVRSNWMHHHKGKPRAFWLEVGRRVSARGVSRNDHAEVSAVVREVETDWRRK